MTAASKASAAEWKASCLQEREDHQRTLRDVATLAETLGTLTRTLPLMVESAERSAAVLQAMSRAMDNKILKEMLRDCAMEQERHLGFYVPRLEALRAALDEVNELKGKMTSGSGR